MYIVELIKHHLKHNKSCKYLPKTINAETIQVVYNLSIPNWVNDKEVLTQDNMNIMYSKYIPSKEYGYEGFHYLHHYVTKKNADEVYPLVGNKKWFRVFKDYKVQDLITKNITSYFSQEAELLLREIKSYILLQKIGDLSGKWEAVNVGQYYHSTKLNYAYSKISWPTPNTEPCLIVNEEEQPIDFNINAI